MKRPIITKLENLQENLKIARHCYEDRKFKATSEWLTARVAEQEAIIATATAKLNEIHATHEKAKLEMPAEKANMDAKEFALREYFNRGVVTRTKDKADDVVEKMKELIAQLRASGVSEEKISEALGL
jgi:uncharacterized coiled-coil protein SlyX